MDDWKEKFLDTFYLVDEYSHMDGIVPADIIVFISSLLSSQEQKHKKEMEELIEEMENEQIFEYPEIVKYPKMQKISCEQAFIAGQLNMKMRLYDLKSKYLTKGKE